VDRATAKVVGVDHKTVAAVRSEGEGRGDFPHVEERTDTKGRKQPTRKPVAAPAKPAPETIPLPLFHVPPTAPSEWTAAVAEKELVQVPSTDPTGLSDQPTGTSPPNPERELQPTTSPVKTIRGIDDGSAAVEDDETNTNAARFSVNFGPPRAIAKRLFQKLAPDVFREVVAAMYELLQNNGVH